MKRGLGDVLASFDIRKAFGDALENMAQLLTDEEQWKGLYIDYHPPTVLRLWRPWRNDYRLSLHKILPCEADEALFHPHRWPSTMKVVAGTYEMAIGYGTGGPETPPPVAVTVFLTPGSFYEMVEPHGWHSVRPLGGPSWSVMLSGKPWDRPAPESDAPLRELTKSERADMFHEFRSYL